MKIGVLAVQGAFLEHRKMIEKIAKESNDTIECIEIRQKKDLEGIDGIILPGGESTVQGQLLRKLDLFKPIQKMIQNGLPVLATCAGLILLSEEIENDETHHLSTLPVTVKRNAYGRQLGSFQTKDTFGQLDNFPHVFIRAPYIVRTKNDQVKVLSTVDDHIVAVQYHKQIGLAFHPELTNDTRIHRYFVDSIKVG